MKANELRIGNFVLQDNEIISGITSNSIHKFDLELIKLEPIPLTKEWFNRFGYYNENRPNHFEKDEYTIDSHTFWDCNGMFIDDKNGVRIKYVHQLQNLYFALQQKELKIIIKNSDFAKVNRILIINIYMSTRLLNCLKSVGIDYLDELSEYTLYKISRIRHIGIKSLSELQEIMSKNNIKFKQ